MKTNPLPDAESEQLIRQLRSLERALPLDVEAVAASVVNARRLRLRRHRYFAGSLIAVCVLATAGWYLRMQPETTAPSRAMVRDLASSKNAIGQSSIDRAERLLEIDRSIAQLSVQQQRLQQLSSRATYGVDDAKAQRQEQALLFWRAEVSPHIERPNLANLYVDSARVTP